MKTSIKKHPAMYSQDNRDNVRQPQAGKKVRLTFSQHKAEPGDRQSITLSPGLYLVATPIGNLGDLSLRAWHILNACDRIICEDTRVARRLFTAHGLRGHGPRGHFTAYHDHNAQRLRPRILKQLQVGATVALISDAGTPLISDPGLKLVQACQDTGVDLFTVPGPNAALAALVVSGLPCDRFFFAGFLPVRRAARQRDIRMLGAIPGSLIFYERASRVAVTLADLAALLGDRPAAVARELTKLHEEVRRDYLSALASYYQQAPPRGEIVILVGPADRYTRNEAQDSGFTCQSLDTSLSAGDPLTTALMIALHHHSPRDAARLVAEKIGVPKRRAYARAVELTAQSDNKKLDQHPVTKK